METVLTSFDNEITILYKIADLFDVPVKYLAGLLIDEPEASAETLSTVIGQYRYERLASVISTLIESGQGLIEIYTYLTSDVVSLSLTRRIPYELSMLYYQLKDRNPDTLTEINELFTQTESTNEIIDDATELTFKYEAWLAHYNQEHEHDIELVSRIKDRQDSLQSIEPLPVSALVIDQVTVQGIPRARTNDEDDNIAATDGLQLFDTAVVSEALPYIQYNGNIDGDDYGGEPLSLPREKFYKLFTGKTEDTIPNYNQIVIPAAKSTSQNTFYMSIASDIDNDYMRAVYNLDRNLLTVTMPTSEGQNERTVLDKITSSLPINIDDTHEVRISGNFYLYGVNIIESLFLDMLLTDELMYSYLYVDETTTAYPDKKRLTLHFRSLTNLDVDETKSGSSVTATVAQLYATANQPIDVLTDNGIVSYNLKEGDPYLSVKISRANSRDIAAQFISIFNRLIGYYLDKLENRYEPRDDNPIFDESGGLEALYAAYFPDFQSRSLKGTEQVKVGRNIVGSTRTKKSSNIFQLQGQAQELIVKGYARVCQRIRQPIIITEEEIPEWQARTFVRGGITHPRQVMYFPPDNPKWIFVCPTDHHPDPGLQYNDSLINKDIYPYVPCCFKEDQMNPNANSFYNEYYRGRPKITKAKSKSNHIMTTNKVLEPGRHAELPSVIENLLKQYAYDSNKIYTTGVVRSVNSLLHCVLLAINAADYIRLDNDAAREDYVIRVRRNMAARINPDLLRQELYDLTPEEIRANLNNVNLFLDPSLYYRAVEEYFTINIFVFSYKSDRVAAQAMSFLDIPRHKYFHARPKRNRYSIVIYKNLGSESDRLTYPQCELIVDYNEQKKEEIRLFSEDMTNLLYDTLRGVQRVITFSIEDRNIVARENIYSLVNFYDLIQFDPVSKTPRPFKVTAQIIDGYGKLRGLVFDADIGNGNERITVLIPSSQPENLPVVRTPTSANVKTVLRIFINPTAITLNGNGQVNGLWYRALDLEYGLYIPIEETDIDSITELVGSLPVGPANPMFTEASNNQVITRSRKLSRDLNIILQLVLWLLMIYSGETVTRGIASRFSERYLTVGADINLDSANIYDLTGVRSIRALPLFETVTEAISYLSEIVPSLFREDKLYLYNRKFYDGIVYFLQQYENNNLLLAPVRQTNLEGLYQYESDFIANEHTVVFIGEKGLNQWLNSIGVYVGQSRTVMRDVSGLYIRDRLDLSYGLNGQPYLYITPVNESGGGQIYLIQNIVTKSTASPLEVALNIADRWRREKINPDYNRMALTVKPDELSYVVYTISKAASLLLLEDHRINESTERYLEVLQYDVNRDQYAAMLPLL